MIFTEEDPASPAGALHIQIDGRCPLSKDLIGALGSVCDAAEDGGESSVVRMVLSGAPEEGWTRGLDVGLVTKWERALRRIERLPATTLAVAAGDCGGMALDALLVADYRVATTDARLLAVAEGGVVWPGMTLYRLSQQVGAARSRRAVLFGQAIEVGEALHLGLVDALVVDVAAALAPVEELVGRRAGPDLAIRRRLLLEATSTSFENALGTHLAACDRVLRAVVSEATGP
jgi:isomerase DpgB